MAIDALIFDFDGVIIDTETSDYEIWREFYRLHGLDLDVNLWMTRVGTNEGVGFEPASHFEEVTGTKLDEAFRAEQFKRYLERCEQQPLLAGVKELLQEARERKIKLAVASSSRRDWVEGWLKRHDLRHFFTCVRTREDVKMGKPAPDLYISAAECLGVPIDRCLAIEDSPNGMNAALAAGMRCLAVPNTLTARLKRPEVSLTLQSLADLDLKQLLARF